jgi:hypothetical protein
MDGGVGRENCVNRIIEHRSKMPDIL